MVSASSKGSLAAQSITVLTWPVAIPARSAGGTVA